MSTTHSSLRTARRGNVLVLLAVLLPVLIGVVGLVIDGGMMMDQHPFSGRGF